ncbi:geobacter CxxxxCH...CXXCH motif protein [Geobacter sp. OR-1]|uniref:CxxxxCH/CxxCH domain c-type cytochrome n=1 Tax=Geobacter sp. OR-1 TaxID=1266765 RepID=UPI000543DA8D|nr:CxxxxCH/CxxCH domain-containing protein [Geobacter sp. OR-1]GAM09958.1 geobacter CxxxxCH...CXXCH motif protein [Geobacter sp. OR-1]
MNRPVSSLLGPIGNCIERMTGSLFKLACITALLLLPALASASPAEMLHNSANLGTKYGTWGASYTCQTCHEKAASMNVKKLKSNVITPTGARPVIFNRYTGGANSAVGIFGNDLRTVNTQTSRNVCEVCHHNTIYHQYSASKISDKTHTSHKSNRKDCTDCHKHNVGYKPPDPKACNVCHGYPPIDNSYYGGPSGMVTPPTLALGGTVDTPPQNIGAHNKHRNILGFECQVCHNNYGHGYAGNDAIEFGFKIDQDTWPPFSGTVTRGEIIGTSAASFRNNFAVAPSNPETTLTRAPDVTSCNVYCHGGFWNYSSGRTTKAVSWVQGPLGSCENSSCHGTTQANPPTPVMGNISTGAHKTHVAKLGNDKTRCAFCHDDYYTPNRHMVNGHVKINLSSLSPSATYKGFNQFSTAYLATTGVYGNCTNIYCHSNVQSPDGSGQATSYKTVAWGGSRIGCDGCHGGIRTDSSPMVTGAHGRHITDYGFSCNECHKNAGNDQPTKHADSSIDVLFDGSLGGSYSQSPNVAGNGYGSCAANYCHSDGNGTTKTVGWGAGLQGCADCHKADVASGSPIDTGMHSQHINQSGVLGRNIACADCHANTLSSGMTIGNVANHVNKFKDFSGAFSGKNKAACNSAYCHSDGKGAAGINVDWNSGPAINDCKGCHGTDAAPDFVSAAGEPNYVNSGAGTPRANSHKRHMGGIGATSCVFCHNESVDATGALTATTKHLDGTRSVASGGGRSFSYDSSSRTCSAISCHGGAAPAQWGQSFPADCTGCHGNNADSSLPQTSGKHAAHMNNAALLGTNYPCITCHALTVSSDRTIADPAYHGNGFKNYTGPLAGSRSSYATATGICSASYCHSDGKGAQKDMTLTNWKSPATLDCKGCHGSDASPAFVSSAGEPNYASTGAGSIRANSHQNHVDTAAAACINCHAATVAVDGTAITGNHTNRVIDVAPGNGKSFTWASTGKTCSDISCHGGKGSFTQTWGAPLTANCLGCHGNNVASGTPIASGAHTPHMNNAALLGSNYSCTECHAKTINPDERSFAFPANHGNGYKNFSGVRAGGDAGYATSTGVCSATYCHTDGKGTQKMTAATGWNSGSTLDCRGCHGSDGAPAFVSAAGEPNYVSTGAAQTKANSHQKHVGTVSQSTTCVYCHGNTVNEAGTAVVGNHTNRIINVDQGGGKSFTWTQGDKTCASISCHGAGSPSAQWGQGFPADCTGCHGGNSGSANPLATGRHTAHINNANVLGANFGCIACHAVSVTSDTDISNALTHANGFTNYSGSMAGRNKTACATSYCHSDGKGSSGRSVDWSTGPALGCDGCHGAASEAGSFISVAGEPNYATAAGLRANSHENHTKKITGQTGAASCDICHTNTVAVSGTVIKAGSSHLNRQINVDFNRAKELTAVWTAGNRTCTNIACHNNGTAIWGDASSAGCRVCHPSLSGAHSAHISDLMSAGYVTMYNYTANRSSGSVYRYGCANCHPTDSAKHRNGTVDIDVSSTKAGRSYLAGLNTMVTTSAEGYTRTSPTQFTCDLVYCHSSGKSLAQVAGDYRQSPNWYGGSYSGNKCGMCHDNPPQYAGQSHYVANSQLGDNGRGVAWESGHMIGIHFKNTSKGNKQNGFLGYSSSGNMAHGNSAFATTITCNLCHSGVVSSTQIDTYAMSGTTSKFKCAGCHSSGSRTPLQPGSIVDTSLHINGAKNIAFAPVAVRTKAQLSNVANALGWGRQGSYKTADSYDSFDLSVSTWDPQTKTCLTACHVNQPGITWGAGLQCSSCHANQ